MSGQTFLLLTLQLYIYRYCHRTPQPPNNVGNSKDNACHLLYIDGADVVNDGDLVDDVDLDAGAAVELDQFRQLNA
jgi:hypothetical protein